MNNLLLTEREGCTGESDSLRRRANARNVSFRISLRWLIHIINPVDKTQLSQYSPVRLELAYDRFQGNDPYGKIPTKKEPIRTLGFALPYNKFKYYLTLELLFAYNYNFWQSNLLHGITLNYDIILPRRSSLSWRRGFSHDVTAAMLVFQTNLVRVNPFLMLILSFD